jgi:hypothetical protein
MTRSPSVSHHSKWPAAGTGRLGTNHTYRTSSPFELRLHACLPGQSEAAISGLFDSGTADAAGTDDLRLLYPHWQFAANWASPRIRGHAPLRSRGSRGPRPGRPWWWRAVTRPCRCSRPRWRCSTPRSRSAGGRAAAARRSGWPRPGWSTWPVRTCSAGPASTTPARPGSCWPGGVPRCSGSRPGGKAWSSGRSWRAPSAGSPTWPGAGCGW